jgi:hypothetical protein
MTPPRYSPCRLWLVPHAVNYRVHDLCSSCGGGRTWPIEPQSATDWVDRSLGREADIFGDSANGVQRSRWRPGCGSAQTRRQMPVRSDGFGHVGTVPNMSTESQDTRTHQTFTAYFWMCHKIRTRPIGCVGHDDAHRSTLAFKVTTSGSPGPESQVDAFTNLSRVAGQCEVYFG